MTAGAAIAADPIAPPDGAPVRAPEGALIGDHARRLARARPHERAIVEVRADGARTVSRGELEREVERIAAALVELGVRPGEAVAFQLPNHASFVAIALATMRIGAVCEPLMPIFRERELAFMLAASRARVLFAPRRFRGTDHVAMALALAARGEAGELEHVVALGGAGDGAAEGVTVHDYAELPGATRQTAVDERRPPADAIAQLLFTSGTTGEPKGVLHRHDRLMLAARAHLDHYGLDSSDVVYVPSPLAHQTGYLYGMWIALLAGAPLIVQESWDPVIGLGALRRHGGTFVQAATPFLADLTDTARARGERPEALRTFVATGAAVPRALAREARDVLGAAVCGAWGTTEACLGAGGAPGDPPEKSWGADGRALPGAELRIADEEDRPLAAGVEGNLQLRTGAMFVAYLDRPDLTAEAMTADGYYRSGDLATLDPDGYLRITGRVKDVINRGGEKVPVAEIEQLLHAHDSVREAAIVAMPDARLGERACAFVVASDGARLTFAQLQDYLAAERVAKPYWPERLELIAELPRTPSGKVRKHVLRERARELVNVPTTEGRA